MYASGTQQVVVLPTVAGYSGQIVVPQVSVAQSMTLQMSTSVPQAQTTVIRKLRPEAVAYEPLLYITLTASAATTMFGTPGYTISLPSGVSPAGLQFFFAVSTNNSQAFLLGPATVNADGTITFALNASQNMVFQSAQTFQFALFGIAGTSPSSTPQAGSYFNLFPVPGQPNAIATGPDGNLWIGLQTAAPAGSANSGQTEWAAAKMTTAGVVTQYLMPSTNVNVGALIPGPSEEMWIAATGFTDGCVEDSACNEIDAVTTSGSFTSFPLAAGTAAVSIAVGGDGNIWFSDWPNADIYQLNVSNGIETPYPLHEPSGVAAPVSANSVVSDGSGNVWFIAGLPSTDTATYVGKMTTSGVVTYFAVPNGAAAVTTQLVYNPVDSDVWFVGQSDLGQVTAQGTVSTYSLPAGVSAVRTGAVAADGSIWFIESTNDQSGNRIGHMDVNGNYLGDYPVPASLTGADYVTIGPDGNVWFSSTSSQYVGQLVIEAGADGRKRR